jgi:Domain of unknown function (DUF5606)
MEYEKIIAVTGLPGLYEMVSSKNDGAIVRSLEDKNTRFVSSRVHNFSHLESIEVFTSRDNVNLVEVFEAMEKGSEKLPDEKDNGALKKYFEKVYPELDFERVYASDMKKMVKWFSVLKANNIEIKLRPAPVEEEPAPEPVEKVVKEKPAKKETKETKAEAPAKKTAKAATAPAKKEKKEEPKKEEPKKKAATKAKKDAPKKEAPAKKKAAPKKKTK